MILLGSVSALPLILLLMKLTKIAMATLSEQAYQPKQASNAWGAVAQVVGNLIDTGLGFVQQNKQNNFASDEAKAQRLFESQEAKKSRDWQKFMLDYNSPEYQKNRLLEAGYTPWFSEGGQAVSSPQTPSAPGIPSGSMAAPSSHMVNSNFGSLGRLLLDTNAVGSQIINRNAETAKVAGEVHTSMLKNGASYEMANSVYNNIMKAAGHSQKVIEDSRNQINYDYLLTKIQADRESFQYQLDTAYGFREREKKLDVLDQEMEKWKAEIIKLHKSGKLDVAKANEAAQNAAYLIAKTLTENNTRDSYVKLLQGQAAMYDNNMVGNSYVGDMGAFGKFLNTVVFYLSQLFGGSANLNIGVKK